jgi:phosphoserine phosphatase
LIQPWSKQFEASLICTKLESRDGKLTGRIEGNNCRGKEKVRRIQLNYNLVEYDEVLAYGDSKGDKPMLGLAIQFYKPFR